MDRDWVLNIAFPEGHLTCGNPDISVPTVITASQNPVFNQLTDGDGKDGFFQFAFRHEDIKHEFVLKGTIDDPSNWATSANVMTPRQEEGSWSWIVFTSGRNRRDGCTGEGEFVNWTATFTPTK